MTKKNENNDNIYVNNNGTCNKIKYAQALKNIEDSNNCRGLNKLFRL